MKDEIHLFIRNDTGDHGYVDDGTIKIKLRDFGIELDKKADDKYKIIIEQCSIVTTTADLTGLYITCTSHGNKDVHNILGANSSEMILSYIQLSYTSGGTGYGNQQNKIKSNEFYMNTDELIFNIKRDASANDFTLDDNATVNMKIVIKKV